MELADVNVHPSAIEGTEILYDRMPDTTLCQIEQPALDKLVQEGSVYPALTLRQAEVLPYLLGQKRWKKRTRPAVKAGLRSFRRFVTATLNDWSSKQRQFTSDSLRDLLLRIEQETHHA